MDLIERLTKRRATIEAAITSQVTWRAQLQERIEAADARLAKHRAEAAEIHDLLEALRN